MVKQWAFKVDVNNCIGCMACQVACADYFDLGEKQLFRKLNEVEEGDIKMEAGVVKENSIHACWVTTSCNHCENPACLASCPTGAIKKRDDGIVYIDPDVCEGSRNCIVACPYDVPQYNPETNKTHKCDFCMERIDEGLNPICVDSCTLRVLTHGDMYEMEETGLERDVAGQPLYWLTDSTTLYRPHRNFQ